MVHLHTRFTDPAAVETWDACFRWREGDALRDVTIDDTWRRVAEAVAVAEGGQAPVWAQRFAQAFSRWRVLPCEQLLRLAGTGIAPIPGDPPCAVLNVPEFINVPLGTAPTLDRPAFMEAAALAVRILDDAVLSGAASPPSAPGGMEVGLMGVADALCKLRVHYASDAARAFAADFASALAEGCLRGAVELAAERGATVSGADCAGLAELWRSRGMPAELIDRARTVGIRHVRTAMHPHPLLARLANGVSEGLVPPPSGPRASRRNDAVMLAAHEELNRAMLPWLDATHADATDLAAASVPTREPSLVPASSSPP